MAVKNKYFVRSRISEKKFRQIIRYFVVDLTANQISSLSGISRPTINKILKNVRIRIAEFCEKESVFEKGEVEMDESYFGARRVRGLRGRGAYGKTIVFGLKKRKGRVYTQVIKNCSKRVILPLISRKIATSATVFTDGFKTYDGLVSMGYKKHYRVHHGRKSFQREEERLEIILTGLKTFGVLQK